MLCLYGPGRNGSVATHFNFFISTATLSATSKYVTVWERIGQNEEPAGRNGDPTGRNVEWTKKRPTIPSKIFTNDAQWDQMYLLTSEHEIFAQSFFNLTHFSDNFQLCKILRSFCLY